MTSWYYVQGTERMGPVEEKELHNLFISGALHSESYVWTKGFANWEKLQDVAELKYFLDEIQADMNEQESPEVEFSLDWKNLQATEEIFYIQIGKDRTSSVEDVLGPYSLQELYGAYVQNRITAQTFIYTPGMLYWERIGAVPAIQALWKLDDSVLSSLEMKSPCLVALDRQPVPVVSMIKNVVGNNLTILCGHHFMEGDDLLVSLYKKEELRAKNIKLKVMQVNQFNQTVECDFSNIDDEQKKILNDCTE